MSRTLDCLDRATRVLLRLAPRSFRARYEPELVRTLHDVCADAYAERGWTGLVFAGMTELGSVSGSAVRAALGRTPPVSSGTPRPSGDTGRRRLRPFQWLRHDLRLAVRTLAASKMTSAVAIGTLALGIGVNAAVFSILDSTILRPVPFAHADRLAEVWNLDEQSKFSYPGFGRPLLLEWRKQTDLFERVEAYDITSFVYNAPGGAEMTTGAIVTPGVFSMLGVQPLEGRVFAAGDGRGGTHTRVVISERFWVESLGRAPNVIGRDVTFNGQAYTVIGVMPAAFRFPGAASRFWVPYDLEAPPADAPVRPSRLTAFVRRPASVSPAALVEQVKDRGGRLAKAAGLSSPLSALVHSRARIGDDKTQRSLVVLGGAVAFLLLIVCANLANLSLSRTLARTRDCAVRAALGASRGDLIRETLVENIVVGMTGAVLGLGVAAATLALTIRWLPEGMTLMSMNAIDLDGRVLAFTSICGLTTAILFGLAPALLASRIGVAGMLARDSRSTTGSTASKRLRSALVVAEVTLAIVLLVGAALMTRSFLKLQHIDRGFDTAGLVALRVGLPAAGYTDPYARDAFLDEMVARSSKLPGITAATAGGVPPDTSMITFGKLETAERPGEFSDELILPVYQVWSNYFGAVGIPLRAGRVFADSEARESAIVSESFAKKFWPGGNALGARFRLDGATMWRTIVGIAGEVRQLDLDDSTGSFEVYYPLRRPPGLAPPTARASAAIVDYRTVVVRATDVGVTVGRLRQLVHEVDPRVVIWRVEPVDRLFADAIARPRLVLLLMSVFAALGLVLAAAGIYAVLSYLVTQRKREIGLRLALGAQPQSIRRLILGNGLKLTGVGLLAGVAAALGLVRVMRTLLYEVATSDPIAIVAVVTMVTAVAALASWWPAHRAMQVDPVALLRED